MKIVLTAYDFFPLIGGVSTNVSILANAFVDAGHHVTVVTPTPSERSDEDYRYKVVRHPSFTRLFGLYRRADLIILSNLAIKLIYPLVFIRCPVALRHHSESAFGLSRSWTSPDLIRRDILARARHFMTSAYIGGKSGFDTFEVTHPFADPLHIKAENDQPPNERQGLLFVGRTEPEKGVDWLLDRWSFVRSMLDVSELKIVGKGSLDAAIRARAKTIEGVRHLGEKTRAETAAEMGRARYLIVPSLWDEPFGAVALEGVAAGAMTILTDRGGLPETTGSLGFYYDPDDKVSFTDALRRARQTFETQLSDPAERKTWNQRTHAHVAQFQPETVVKTILTAMSLSDPT